MLLKRKAWVKSYLGVYDDMENNVRKGEPEEKISPKLNIARAAERAEMDAINRLPEHLLTNDDIRKELYRKREQRRKAILLKEGYKPNF